MSNEPVTPAVDHEPVARAAKPPADRVPGAAAPHADQLPVFPGPQARRARRLKLSVSVVCPRCDLIGHVAAGELDRRSSCEHCGQPLFPGRVFDLHEANFDLHVQASQVPTMVLFWASWCEPSQAVLASMERAAHELAPRIRFARVNTDDERELASRCGVRGVPTALLFKHGKEAARRIGRMSLQSIAAWADL